MRSLSYLSACAALGLLIHLRQAWALALWLPATWAFLETGLAQAKRPLRLALEAHLGASLTFAAATLAFLPGAIREASQASWVSTTALAIALCAYQGAHGFGTAALTLVAGRLALSPLARLFVAWASYCTLAAGLPNILSLTGGELLAHYSYFDPWLERVGTIGLTFVTALASTSLAGGARLRSRGLLGLGIAATCLILSLPALLPRDRAPEQRPEGSGVQALLLQTNRDAHRPEADELSSQRPGSLYLEKLSRLVREAASKPPGPRLIVTPEGGMPLVPGVPWTADQASRWEERFDVATRDLLAGLDASLLGVFQAYAATSFGQGRREASIPRRTPTTLLVDSSGAVVDAIPKRTLIPFIESIPEPLAFPFVRRLFPWVLESVEPVDRQVIEFGGLRIAAMICYDSLFRASFHAALGEGADLALVMTNDLLLGEHGAWYHHVATRARQAEYGLPAFYVGNTGYTGPVGGTFLPWGRRDLLPVTFTRRETGPSAYAALVSPWLEPGVAALAAVLVLLCACWASRELWADRDAVVRAIRAAARSEVFLGAAIGAAVLALITRYLVQVIYIPSGSMQPALEPGSRALICVLGRGARRGDIVSFTDPHSGTELVKRVFLAPGDEYRFGSGEPRVNGLPLKAEKVRDDLWLQSGPGTERYLLRSKSSDRLWPEMDLRMDEASYFLLGDHRDQSNDSRKLGPVPAGRILGRLCWPAL
jgi:signal peptidase I